MSTVQVAKPVLPKDLLSMSQAEFDKLYEAVVKPTDLSVKPFWGNVQAHPSCCSCASISSFSYRIDAPADWDSALMQWAKALRARLANVAGWSVNMATACTSYNTAYRSGIRLEQILAKLGFVEQGKAQSCHGDYNVAVWAWFRPRTDGKVHCPGDFK